MLSTMQVVDPVGAVGALALTAALVALVLFGFGRHHTAYRCRCCGRLFRADGQPVIHADTLVVGDDFCPRCGFADEDLRDFLRNK